jgi:hypothetical protein
MTKPLEFRKEHNLATRRWWIGLISLLLLAVAALAEGQTFSKISSCAKRVGLSAAGFWQPDQWRSDANLLVTEFEYLFFPESGAGARLDLEPDE